MSVEILIEAIVTSSDKLEGEKKGTRARNDTWSGPWISVGKGGTPN